MRLRIGVALLLLVLFRPAMVPAETSLGVRPLHKGLEIALATLHPDTHLLLDRETIERFLVELDGMPPDWRQVYGKGHHDSGHDERLFALNRERDAMRQGKAPLDWLVAFVWSGELSQFDEEARGFRVVLGPKFTSTGWGDVRFKHEDLPLPLIALTGQETAQFNKQMSERGPVEIDVLMTGRLLPEESLIYDFSHEKEGWGLIMPVVRIEGVEFALKDESGKRE